MVTGRATKKVECPAPLRLFDNAVDSTRLDAVQQCVNMPLFLEVYAKDSFATNKRRLQRR